MKYRSALALSCAALLAASPAFAGDATPSPAADPAWPTESSDIPLDPVYRLGVLDNGMRYIIAHNATPEGTALVRFSIGSGALEETDSQRGLAHFLEHMAFNGSKRIPEGDMIKLLEREGLAFGADTNASTGIDRTLYKLDLPRNDPALLDTALMLMREAASELTIAPEAVDRERGIVLSERRDRNTYAWQQFMDELAFSTPGARYVERMPVGTLEVLEKGTAADIRDYYEREYVPSNATLVIVGDFDVDMAEARIRDVFSDWKAAPEPREPDAGPVDFDRQGLTDIYTDPALSERVTIIRNGPFVEYPDTSARRRQDLLATIGYEIVNRRLDALARSENAPFRGAGYGTSDIFKAGRTTSLIIDTADGEWSAGFAAAAATLRQALQFGFGEAEVAEQLAKLRMAQENAAAAADTRSNTALTSAALELVTDDRIPASPQSSLDRFNRFAPYVTAAAVWSAMRADAVALDNPLIRFVGRKAPEGGELALRKAWNEAANAPVSAPETRQAIAFAYQDFGTPGTIVSDTTDKRFGLREIRFDNGVMLTLKKTDIERDRIQLRLSIDGGQLIETPDDPLKTAMVAMLPVGGLGKHSQDELETVLSGRTVQFNLSAATDAFVFGATTTPRDLELQLQLIAAAVTDPGYRPEGDQRFRKSVANFFANLDATPARALGNREGAILSDNDPRFSLQSREAYEALSFAKLRDDISDRLHNGAIELALVGDFDEDKAIGFVERTFGALPGREHEFQARPQARKRSFTSDRSVRIVTHSGEADQAIVRLVWPTRDDSDISQDAELRLLDAVMQIVVQDELRERLGQTYSPRVDSSTSSEFPGYGTFSINASVDISDVEAASKAIDAAILRLADEPIDSDLIDRARRPLLEQFSNRLKSLSSWIAVVDRAQSEADRLARFDAWPVEIKAIDGVRLQQALIRWLVDQKPVEILVLPRDSAQARQAGEVAGEQAP